MPLCRALVPDVATAVHSAFRRPCAWLNCTIVTNLPYLTITDGIYRGGSYSDPLRTEHVSIAGCAKMNTDEHVPYKTRAR